MGDFFSLDLRTIEKMFKSLIHTRFIMLLFFVNTLSLYADESSSVFKLGERFYNDSLYNLALEQYQKYLGLKRSHENDPTAYYKIAFCLHKMGNTREAAESFEEFIRLFPSETNVMEAMYMAGTLRKTLGDFKEAYDWFYSVWSRFVGSARARMSLFEAAECAEKDKNHDQAIELYNLFISKFPKNEKAKPASLFLVNLYIERKEYASAEEILKKIEKQWSGDKRFKVRILYFKALLAKKMQKIELAQKRFENMAKQDKHGFPEMEQAYKEYIDILSIQKDFKTAHDMYTKLNSIYAGKSKVATSSFLKAWADNGRRARLYKDAITLYKEILVEPMEDVNIYQIRYNLAECYVGIGDFPEAIETLRDIEMHDSTGEYSFRAVLKTGDLYFKKGLYPSAISAYRRYLQLPDRSDKDRIIYRIGKIYQEEYNRYGAALREYENLLKLYPASNYYQRTVFAVGQCQEALRDYGKAVRNYEYIVESGGDSKLVEKAEKQAQYIRNFLIQDSETAVYKLAEILEKDQAEISKVERLLKTAHIYEKYLKDYSKALEMYNKFETIKSVPDSLKPEVEINKAHIYRKLYEKATFEKNPKMAEHSKKMAIQLYENIINNYGSSSFADEAAYSNMMLISPQIGEYEAYISKYPQSKYLDNIFIIIAKYYEKRSVEEDNKYVKRAVRAYSEIVKRYPSSQHAPQAFVALARNYLTLGEIDSTEKIIKSFVKKFPTSAYDAEVFYIRGLLAERNKDYNSAITIFKQVLYKYPFSVFAERARYELASAELKTGKVFEALNNYRLYQQNYSDGLFTLESRYGIAKCLLHLDKHGEALKLFNELIDEKLSEDILADIHYELARIAESDNKIYDALNHYTKALKYKNIPDRMKVHMKMGSIYFDNRIYDDAASSFIRALEYARTRTDSVVNLTRNITAMIMDGKRKRVDKRIKKFKDKYGDTHKDEIAEIIYYEGTYLIVEKEYDKAINRFKYILQKYEKSPRADDASYQIALSRYYQNKMEEALELFHTFPVEYPASEFVPLAYFKIGMIFHGQNEFIRAAEYFSKVIDEKKVDSKTRFRAANNAAVAYQKTSSWLDAARMYTIVLSNYADIIDVSSYHLKIGFCLLQASKIEEAYDHFKKANENPKKEDKPEILYWIATCYSKLGNFSKAIAEFLKVPYLYAGVGISKWGVTAEFEAARLYERLGEYTKAITLYRKIVQSDGEQGRFGKKAHSRIQRLSALVGEKK